MRPTWISMIMISVCLAFPIDVCQCLTVAMQSTLTAHLLLQSVGVMLQTTGRLIYPTRLLPPRRSSLPLPRFLSCGCHPLITGLVFQAVSTPLPLIKRAATDQAWQQQVLGIAHCRPILRKPNRKLTLGVRLLACLQGADSVAWTRGQPQMMQWSSRRASPAYLPHVCLLVINA
jgi:hypothetical protein